MAVQKFREAAKLPSEFVLSLDFEEFKLIEKAGPPWQNVGQVIAPPASICSYLLIMVSLL